MNWFKPRVEKHYTVVEIEKPTMPAELAASVAEIAALRSHSGFQHLLRRLNYQGALLRAKLITERHDKMEDVMFLQSGIFWCDWLRSQVDFAHDRYLAMREASKSEQDFFESLDSQIERVGLPQDGQLKL